MMTGLHCVFWLAWLTYNSQPVRGLECDSTTQSVTWRFPTVLDEEEYENRQETINDRIKDILDNITNEDGIEIDNIVIAPVSDDEIGGNVTIQVTFDVVACPGREERATLLIQQAKAKYATEAKSPMAGLPTEVESTISTVMATIAGVTGMIAVAGMGYELFKKFKNASAKVGAGVEPNDSPANRPGMSRLAIEDPSSAPAVAVAVDMPMMDPSAPAVAVAVDVPMMDPSAPAVAVEVDMPMMMDPSAPAVAVEVDMPSATVNVPLEPGKLPPLIQLKKPRPVRPLLMPLLKPPTPLSGNPDNPLPTVIELPASVSSVSSQGIYYNMFYM